MLKKTFLLCISLICLVCVACGSENDQPHGAPLDRFPACAYVDPFIGTSGDHGQLHPGATRPFGLVKLGPDTFPRQHAGYDHAAGLIRGFSHTRLGGVGCSGSGGAVLLKPCNDVRRPLEALDKSTERASPGYYGVTLRHGITVELTVSPWVGHHRYTFPASKRPYLFVNASNAYAGSLGASLHVAGASRLAGTVEQRNVCGKGFHRLHYAVQFDRDALSVEQDGEKAWLGFPPTEEGETMHVKVAISPVSVEQALLELERDPFGWDFQAARDDAEDAWEAILGKVRVRGGDEELKTLFYTFLYRSFLVPTDVTASTGEYRAPRDEETLRHTGETAPDYRFYAGWSLWDDFRKYMLLSILEPATYRNVVRSLVDYYKARGTYVSWSEGYWPCPSVRQEFAGALILDALQKGLTDFDLEAAYAGMKVDAEHFPDSDVGLKLERAYHDYLVMRMASILGREGDAKTFRRRARAYADLWNPQQRDNQGNVRGFFTPNGEDVPDVESVDTHAYEGALWHYRWFVLHDVQGLADLRGGREKLADDLATYFEQDLHMVLNEPPVHAPFLFAFLGAPHLTQKWARAYTTKTRVHRYHNHGFFPAPVVRRTFEQSPEGMLPTMDDDTGAMSSWFVYSALGLFPLCPGEPYYVIGSPIFPEVTLRLPGARSFTVRAHHVSEDRFYIQSARLNGRPYGRPWISHADLVRGGVLELEMGDRPNPAWGSMPEDAPPSLSTEGAGRGGRAGHRVVAAEG